MSSTFSRTTRSLATDGSHRRTGKLLIAAALLGAWIAWFLLGRVSVYELTETARLEVTNLPRPVVPLVPGQVMKTDLELGRMVEADQVLVELDDKTERLALAEGRAHLTELRMQVEAIEKEIEAEQAAALAHRKAVQVAIEEYDARIAEADARAKYAEQRAEAWKRLSTNRAAAPDEVREAESEAVANRAAVRALQVAMARHEEDQEVNQRDRQTRIAKLRRERAELTGQMGTQDAAIDRLEREVEVRKVRAPISGRLGQVDDCPVGSAVSSGQVLGFVVPPTEPRAVAFFPVAGAGRIRPSQPARLRLEGFPWIQYGSIPATVADVATEPEQGRIRVELQVKADPGLPIPVEHGLPGSAQVLVERISPAVLVLRTTGWFLRTNRSGGTSRDSLGRP